jgi:hypothetical protein
VSNVIDRMGLVVIVKTNLFRLINSKHLMIYK